MRHVLCRCLAIATITFGASSGSAQHNGHRHHHGGWFGGGFSRVGPFASGFGLGLGGFNYYTGPVGFGYTSWGYPNFGPYFSYIPMAPVVVPSQPLWLGNPYDNPAIQEWLPKSKVQNGNGGQ